MPANFAVVLLILHLKCISNRIILYGKSGSKTVLLSVLKHFKYVSEIVFLCSNQVLEDLNRCCKSTLLLPSPW